MEDIIGKKFNRLTVLKFDHKDKKYNKYYLCKCDCGKETSIVGYHIKNGGVKSCGCLRDEKIQNVNKTHNLSRTSLYHIWSSMKQRCENPSNKSFESYGGRGIKVCNEWKNNFVEFYNWSMENGYKQGLTIDRIDNNGDYNSSNCRWVNMITQMNNTRTNRYINYNGEIKTLTEWARYFGLNVKSFSSKYREFLSISRVLEYFKGR